MVLCSFTEIPEAAPAIPYLPPPSLHQPLNLSCQDLDIKRFKRVPSTRPLAIHHSRPDPRSGLNGSSRTGLDYHRDNSSLEWAPRARVGPD
ncbi:hypothetical protein RRG08_025973 [Elysia crispata]|uniref:Uncharacterized protein n=1 Tax=Elysia crispata TaxID=231223 RepID=A0AAE0ZGF9_9GAST|nr:hypothetical protein RRG08_025973 [Elysia crispata]